MYDMTSTKGTVDSGRAVDQDEQEIIRLEMVRAALIVARDVEAIERLVPDTYTMTRASGAILNKSEVMTALRSGELMYEELRRECHNVTISQNTAAATGLDTIKGVFRGERVDGQYRFRNTYVQTDGRWELVATVASRDE
jgi:hypothetical protein